MFTSIRRFITLVIFSHQLHLVEIEIVFLKTWKLALVIIMALLLQCCSLHVDRTTTVYGTITDENGQPVDSILVMIQGVKKLNYEVLGEVSSDRDGNYEITVEVPKKYRSDNTIIPFGADINPKFQRSYKDYNVRKNNSSAGNCCLTTAGQTTKYDFQLIPK